jgi:hypothetical protein
MILSIITGQRECHGNARIHALYLQKQIQLPRAEDPRLPEINSNAPRQF